MVQGQGSADNEEPQQRVFKLPSVKEHLFQCVDVDEKISEDPNIVFAKIEVVDGEEKARTTMIRLTLDHNDKGYFATRLFLKVIGEEYKGKDFSYDTDNWIGKQFKATIVHNKSKDELKTYANIEEYNFDDMVEELFVAGGVSSSTGEAAASPPEDHCKCPKDEVKTEPDPNNKNISICRSCKKPIIQWDE